MRVGFSEVRIEALADLWNDCLPEKYKVPTEVLAANTIQCNVFDWGASCVEVDDENHPKAFIAVKKSAASLYKGPDPDSAHVSAIVCPRPKEGVELMAYVKRVLRYRGVYKLHFGADSRHFFPGCPTDFTSLRDFLMVEGFAEGGDVYDVQRELQSYSAPEGALERLSDKVQVRPVADAEVPLLDDFFAREFPGRWRYDTMAKIQAEGRSDFVHALFIDGVVEGFAVTQDPSHKLPIAGAVFHMAMGKEWAALGPIGLSKDVRGRGLGDSLLATALLALKGKGLGPCVIDWTVLLDWYGKHGFRPSRTYKSFLLKLEDPF